jgi:WD40 repeat protein/uncharacterized caspase-like protein
MSNKRWITALFSLAAVCRSQQPNPEDQPDASRPHLLRPGFAQRQIQTLSFLPDNRTLVTNDGQNASLWDTENGLLLRSLLNGAGAAITPGGKFLWREVQNPVPRNVRWDLNDLDSQKAAVALARTDLVLSDALDTMLLYRQRENGNTFFTNAPANAPNFQRAEWVPLPAGRGHQEAARFNPAGRTVAIGYFDGKLIVYDCRAKSTLFQAPALEGRAITQVAFSPDGKLVATIAHQQGCLSNLQVTRFTLNGKSDSCNGRSAITVRDAETGKEKFTLGLDPAHSIAFTADARTLAVAGSHRIQLVDVATAKVTRTLPLTADQSSLEPGQYMSVQIAFSPDGKWLAETSHGPIYLFDMASGYVVRALADPPIGFMANSVLTRDNRLLVAVNRPDHIAVTELSPGVSRRILKMRAVSAGMPAISADGSTLASVNADHKVSVWNIDRTELLCTVPGEGITGDFGRKYDLSADGSTLIVPSPGPEGPTQGVEIWETRACREVDKISAPPQPARSVKFAPVTLRAVEGAREPLRTTIRVALSPSGKLAAWINRDNVLTIWNHAERRLIASVRVPVPAIYTSTDQQGRPSNRLQGEQGPLPLSDLPADMDRLLGLEQVAGGIYGINFSPDDSMVATLDSNGQARLWNTADGRLVRTLGTIAPGDTFIFNGALRFTMGFGAMVFSPDSRKAINIYFASSRPMLWDLSTGAALRPLKGFMLWGTSAAFTSDGKTMLSLGRGSNILVMDTATGGPIATVSVFGDGQEWLVHTLDGVFDGSPAAYRQLGWAFPGKGIPPVPLEAFFAEYFRPGLLPELLGGKRVAATRDVDRIDRRQARAQIEAVTGGGAGVPVNAAMASLRIHATPPPPGENNSAPGVIRDLRLFRNGSLVRIWSGALKPAASGTVEVSLNVPVSAGLNQFVAYGFNQDNVQTTKGLLVLEGAPALAHKGIAYIVVAGVNRYENPEFNLRYAAADANLMSAKLAEHLKGTHRYSDVRIVSLLDADVTRRNLETVLVQLAGGAAEPGNARGLAKARPEDAVFLFFAGHGWAQGGRFYLIPHDLGYRGPRARLASDAAGQKAILEHAISDRDLGGLLKDIDAGLVALVIDACNAGQLLESDETRQGPFNSKGLAQLAWDKGMYVLTAAQSYQAALEDSRLQHGYLTYALVEEGLSQRKADRDPEDGEIDIREWFDFASLRVPEMQRERQAQARLLVQRSAAAADVQTPRAFYRYEIGNHLSISGLKPAAAADCAQEANLKAADGAGASLTFENATQSSARKIYWVDGSGNRQFFTTMAPGGVFNVNTSIGHAWVVTDAADTCLAIYTSGARRETAVIQK